MPTREATNDNLYFCSFTASGEHAPSPMGDCIYCGNKGRPHAMRPAAPPSPEGQRGDKHKISYVRNRISGISSAACMCGWFFESNNAGRTSEAGDEHLESAALPEAKPSPLPNTLSPQEGIVDALEQVVREYRDGHRKLGHCSCSKCVKVDELLGVSK